MSNINWGKIYISSPFFNDSQLDRVERVKKLLDELDIKYFSPKDDCLCSSIASRSERKRVFNEDIKNLFNCDTMICVTNDRDIGSLEEAGMFFMIDYFSRPSESITSSSYSDSSFISNDENEVSSFYSNNFINNKKPFKKLIYLYETDSSTAFNLMLAESAFAISKSIDDLRKILVSGNPIEEYFEGEIE